MAYWSPPAGESIRYGKGNRGAGSELAVGRLTRSTPRKNPEEGATLSIKVDLCRRLGNSRGAKSVSCRGKERMKSLAPEAQDGEGHRKCVFLDYPRVGCGWARHGDVPTASISCFLYLHSNLSSTNHLNLQGREVFAKKDEIILLLKRFLHWTVQHLVGPLRRQGGAPKPNGFLLNLVVPAENYQQIILNRAPATFSKTNRCLLPQSRKKFCWDMRWFNINLHSA